jgi:hypothetical protein
MLVIGYAALRIAYAVELLVAPGRATRPWLAALAVREDLAARGFKRG